MDRETRITLDILAESKHNAHQRRYDAVVRFIDMYGIIPSKDRILSDLPEKTSLISLMQLPDNLAEKINYYEDLLEVDSKNTDVIRNLDQLYDEYYRQVKIQPILSRNGNQKKK